MIDASNHITLDRAEDTFLPFSWVDSDGTPIDLAPLDIEFVVKGGFTLAPTISTDDHTQRILHFTPDHAASLGSKARDYMVHVVLDGLTQKVLWRGTIEAEGFAV